MRSGMTSMTTTTTETERSKREIADGERRGDDSGTSTRRATVRKRASPPHATETCRVAQDARSGASLDGR